MLRAVVVPWAWSNPGVMDIGFVSDLVREDLGGALSAPASDDSTEVEFMVEPGDTPALLAPKLAEAGIIANERAFLYEARVEGLTPKLNAGRFALALNLTPQQVVDGLVNNRIETRTVQLPVREGLRLEQIVAKLQTIPGTDVDPKDFYNLVTKPPDSLLGDYPWLLDETVRPKGATLEGFLFPATYTIRVGDEDPTTAEDLVREMLDAFHDRVGDERLHVPEKRGLTFYQVLTLASIVEREAVLDDERAKIAGVYQNRIDRVPSVAHGLLQADPTVIYAVDTVNLGKYSPDWANYFFWKIPDGGIRDQVLPEDLAGYNTYKVRGLPPGPIATPTVASIDAALAPDVEEQVHVLRRDPRRERRARLQQVARGARAEAARVRLLGWRSAGPRRCRCPRTSPRRPTRRPANAGSRPSGPIARAASPPCARGWRTRASTPTSAPSASTCAG